jgi:hypothetical protein
MTKLFGATHFMNHECKKKKNDDLRSQSTTDATAFIEQGVDDLVCNPPLRIL